ncbi:MAG: hypothetical protein HY337_11350 [Gemmatimonadetes bacterium]|nr:hypothetical protein [Gemmatimonadota bacterium]
MTQLRRLLATSTTLSLTLFSSARLNAQSLSSQTLSGLRFRDIGPVTMSGRVVDLAVVENNPYTFYIASATGGVWKTTNHGITIAPVFHNEATHSVGAVAVHQVDTNIVWVGTGERANRQSSSWGDGVYKSTDGGKTWRNMGLRDSHHIGRIALHPTDPNIVFVAAMGHLWGPSEERGLYMSRDGGGSWTRVLHVDSITGVVDVAIDPYDPSTMYAASYQRMRKAFGFHGGGPGSALWKSTDGGRTWRKVTAGLPTSDKGRIGISIYRRDPRVVYICVEQGYRYNASTAYTGRAAGVYRSEDKGETWTHMSDWNPRPMYASQILVDPSDDRRIYMQNSFSWSDDGGKTFRPARQSLHGDDRILWVNPRDSRHVIKGDDGGVGVSYDRAVTWLFLTHLPVSQYYRVRVDNQKPYHVYGGLQDNGSWIGPSATYLAAGIRLEDWFQVNGGDGFLSWPDTADGRTVYTESQYLGLQRLDLLTRERKSIRPGDPRGAIGGRRNFEAWFTSTPEPELLNAMASANWDGPFIISAFDNNTLYAGTNKLWKSTDKGDTWQDLGDLTTKVNRRELTIMGQRAQDSTASLDDGVPYYPTLSAIAESPLRRGVLYVGTDDGNLQVSQDDGRTWATVISRVPSLPRSVWISGIEPSRHAAGTVYVAINNYRNNDFANYLFRSTDFGQTWTSIVGNLPPRRVLRTIREDLRNPRVLYLGTELGLFYSNDGGTSWVELRSNLPTMAVNDLVTHQRDNDLILGTHGRGIQILDNINVLQELTPQIMRADAHLFTVEPAEQIRYADETAHVGDMVFRGENPPAGAIVDYFLRERRDSSAVSLTIHDASGREINRVRPAVAAGVNRVVWNLRHADLVTPRPGAAAQQFGFGGGGGRVQGPWVMPGEYTVRLTVGGTAREQQVRVMNDPRITLSGPALAAWHDTLVALGEMIRTFAPRADAVVALKQRLDSLPAAQRGRTAEQMRELNEVVELAQEFRSRLTGLYNEMGNWTAPITADQRSQLSYYREFVGRLDPRVARVLR